MSHPHDDDGVGTAAQVSRIARQGVYTSPTSVDPAAAHLAEALIATLDGTAEQPVLPSELRSLAEQVRRRATIGFPRITAEDGVRLSAHTIKLNTGEPAPLVIVPAGWTPFGWGLFAYTYLQLALRGYHVLAYTPRGIGLTMAVPGQGYVDGPFTSGGTIDVAGPADVQDGITVLAYAQQHFSPGKIAFLGESYGSGISQLVAANDPEERVAAIVALSTWGDLTASLYQHETRHLAAVAALIGFTGGPPERKFDEDTRQMLADFQAGENMKAVAEWGRRRSPATYADKTNARGIPTFFSNTWHETLFGANQVIEHFESLTVPKRLNLWIGDHAAPEGAGLTIPFSGPNPPVEEAFAWLDHHVRGIDNEVPGWSPVSSQIMFTYETRTDPQTGNRDIVTPADRESRASWQDVTVSTERWYLTGTGPDDRDGGLGASPESGWERAFTVGQVTEPTAADAVITTGQAEWNGNPRTYAPDKFDRQYLAVFTSDPITADSRGGAARRIRGVPELTLTVRGTDASATLVAYLFDVGPDGTARIITHEPLTLTGLTPGQERAATWKLQAAGYDLADGHRLTLAVTSGDALYSDAATDAGTDGGTTTLGSSDDGAACLVLPLG
ncbi:alpha/beta fold hydrolase [Streptomyces sp. NPDC017086]|uniref:alpha/beta fold hydrolase n=1 Tax=Streptomyces sp. NPDC017086 TaxID=3364976 RepID=UPI0037B8BE96